MITNQRGKILCRHIATGKTNFMDISFVNNSALMKTKGWQVVQEPQPPPPAETPLISINANTTDQVPPAKKKGGRPKKQAA